MAQVTNPRKLFQFTILIAGMNPFLAQEVKLPDMDIDPVSHGDTNYDVKTAGRVTYGNLVISKLCPTIPFDSGFLNDMRLVQSTTLGGGAIPELYKKICTVIQFANDGKTPIQTWVYEGVWPSKINGIEFGRTKSENTIETIEFSVDRLLL